MSSFASYACDEDVPGNSTGRASEVMVKSLLKKPGIWLGAGSPAQSQVGTSEANRKTRGRDLCFGNWQSAISGTMRSPTKNRAVCSLIGQIFPIMFCRRSRPKRWPTFSRANMEYVKTSLPEARTAGRTRANIDDTANIHCLRHTFASWAVMGGLSLAHTGALLGHRSSQTTLRCADHLTEAVREYSQNGEPAGRLLERNDL